MDRDGILVIKGPKGINDCDPLRCILKESIEFTDLSGPLVLGGFGAFGHPTSFHHPDIRFIRQYVYDHVKPILSENFDHANLELLFDRVSIRRTGTSTSKETWHRDICPVKSEGDIVLGGWINLDPSGSPPQYFSCVPGTHNDPDTGSGFHMIEDSSEYNKMKVLYTIQPGEIILFNQNLVHEIKSQKSKFDSKRLYLGWRLTNETKPLFDHSQVIEDQGVPFIPSGQVPPMYAKLHRVNHKHMVIDFSKRIHPVYIDPKTQLIYRELKSLKEANLKMWPEYTDKEKRILTPQPL